MPLVRPAGGERGESASESSALLGPFGVELSQPDVRVFKLMLRMPARGESCAVAVVAGRDDGDSGDGMPAAPPRGLRGLIGDRGAPRP